MATGTLEIARSRSATWRNVCVAQPVAGFPGPALPVRSSRLKQIGSLDLVDNSMAAEGSCRVSACGSRILGLRGFLWVISDGEVLQCIVITATLSASGDSET